MFLYVHSRHILLHEEESGNSINADFDSVIKPWHVYVGYIVINAFAFGWNCYARWLPVIAQVSLFTSLISFFVIMVTVPAKASPHQEARFVFANFVNATGWNQNGIGMSIFSVSFSSGTLLLSVFHDSLTAVRLLHLQSDQQICFRNMGSHKFKYLRIDSLHENCNLAPSHFLFSPQCFEG